jgi:hypothetical protein
MEEIWQELIDTLVKVFSDDVAEMTMVFQDYLYNARQFHSVKYPYSDYPQIISVTGQQVDTRSFTDLLKRTGAFPATTWVCEGLFCQ